jgi:hypothetical protein
MINPTQAPNRPGRSSTEKYGIGSLILTALLSAVLWAAPIQAARYNGFDLTGSEVARTEIKRGGPPRDGIPSIDHPDFLPAAASDHWLEPGDWVVGVRFNGVARAYPVRILNHHEIVNDRFGDEGIVISYCPLCRSAIAFRSRVDGQDHSFGVSGLLWNSDVLMYDRETESLWSQIAGRAISGPVQGAELDTIPLIHTTWAEWTGLHPDTVALSPKTGYRRNYSHDPYSQYGKSRQLMFPVGNRDNRYHNKEVVIGMVSGGVARAWPYTELEDAWKQQPGMEYLLDSINGISVRIRFNPQTRGAYLTDEQDILLDALSSYWFAWVAFHPETEVWTAP